MYFTDTSVVEPQYLLIKEAGLWGSLARFGTKALGSSAGRKALSFGSRALESGAGRRALRWGEKGLQRGSEFLGSLSGKLKNYRNTINIKPVRAIEQPKMLNPPGAVKPNRITNPRRLLGPPKATDVSKEINMPKAPEMPKPVNVSETPNLPAPQRLPEMTSPQRVGRARRPMTEEEIIDAEWTPIEETATSAAPSSWKNRKLFGMNKKVLIGTGIGGAGIAGAYGLSGDNRYGNNQGGFSFPTMGGSGFASNESPYNYPAWYRSLILQRKLS